MRKVLDNSGFGIIEVLVSLSLVVIIIVSLGSVLGAVYKLYSASQYKIQAYSFAQEPIEILNGIKNQHFACVCNNPDDCSTVAGFCINNSDGQSCELRDGFTSCWMEYPENMSAATAYFVQDLGGGNWQLSILALGTKETISADPQYTREVLIENLARDGDGNIDPSGTIINYDTKKVTVNIYWTERGVEKIISLSNIFTSWLSL